MDIGESCWESCYGGEASMRYEIEGIVDLAEVSKLSKKIFPVLQLVSNYIITSRSTHALGFASTTGWNCSMRMATLASPGSTRTLKAPWRRLMPTNGEW